MTYEKFAHKFFYEASAYERCDNMSYTTTTDGLRIMYSWRAPIAILDGNKLYISTDVFSSYTSRQISKVVRACPYNVSKFYCLFSQYDTTIRSKKDCIDLAKEAIEHALKLDIATVANRDIIGSTLHNAKLFNDNFLKLPKALLNKLIALDNKATDVEEVKKAKSTKRLQKKNAGLIAEAEATTQQELSIALEKLINTAVTDAYDMGTFSYALRCVLGRPSFIKLSAARKTVIKKANHYLVIDEYGNIMPVYTDSLDSTVTLSSTIPIKLICKRYKQNEFKKHEALNGTPYRFYGPDNDDASTVIVGCHKFDKEQLDKIVDVILDDTVDRKEYYNKHLELATPLKSKIESMIKRSNTKLNKILKGLK